MSHQRNNPQVSHQTRITGQRLVALIAGVVVLLIAFTFIGISQASRLGASAPQLPPAKATLLARADATMAAGAGAESPPHQARLYATSGSSDSNLHLRDLLQ